MIKTNFLSNQGQVTLTTIIRSEISDLYAQAQSISLLWCKFQIVTDTLIIALRVKSKGLVFKDKIYLHF